MSVLQITPHKRWPSGDSRPLAVIRFEPEEISTRFGLVFEEDVDDLDRFLLAAVELSDGQQVWLIRYRGAPKQGTEVHVDIEANVTTTRKTFLKDFEITEQDLDWWPTS